MMKGFHFRRAVQVSRNLGPYRLLVLHYVCLFAGSCFGLAVLVCSFVWFSCLCFLVCLSVCLSLLLGVRLCASRFACLLAFLLACVERCFFASLPLRLLA